MVNMIYLVASVAIGVGVLLTYYAFRRLAAAQKLLVDARSRQKNIKRDLEEERRESASRIKDEIYRRRKDFEQEIKRDRAEQERLRSRLNAKYADLDQEEERVQELHRELQQKERELLRETDAQRMNETKIKKVYEDLMSKLEAIGGMGREEAKRTLLDTLKSEVEHSSQKWIQKLEEETRKTAKSRANDIVVTAMQRYTADQVTATSAGVVHLPSDDMKGRIIGKEGRNIKALEMATGMEFVIGEIPEIITISGFNPIRREVARRTLEKLIADGRINPTRIEDMVRNTEAELDDIIQETGKELVLEYNLPGLDPEMVTLLGKLHFRTSYSQNVLVHSKEVALFSRMIAEELGLDGPTAFRAGLLHDIGKAVTAEIEGPHAQIGAEIAKRCGESANVVNAIAAHHEEVAFSSVYSPIVVVADTISASRPGARRETLSTYIKRVEKLEEIAQSFPGIKRAYALQAGREVRIIVEEDSLNDEKTLLLAREIAAKIEAEMNFPGQIKVNVIREKRAIEYAR